MLMYSGDCSSLPNPDNGLVSSSGTTPGSTAAYSCDSRCTRRGSRTRTCQSDGTWSGSAPTCECMYMYIQLVVCFTVVLNFFHCVKV